MVFLSVVGASWSPVQASQHRRPPSQVSGSQPAPLAPQWGQRGCCVRSEAEATLDPSGGHRREPGPALSQPDAAVSLRPQPCPRLRT